LLDESELSAIEVHWPTTCPTCHADLPAEVPEEGEVLRQQVWELPPLEPEVIEHRYPAVRCPACQTTVRAERPADVPPGSFGPRLTSLVGLLNGRYRLSKREVADLLDSVLGVEMSVGMVVRATEQLSAALEAPYDEVRAALASAEQANVDETGWKQAGARRWLWVAVSTVATLFYLACSRAGQELERLLGASFGGIVGSDRYRAYLRLPLAQRQLCWAHLKRDLVACSQASGASGEWGKRALEVVAELFRLWHQFKQQAIDRPTLQAEMQPYRETFAALLVGGLTLPVWSKAHAFCSDVRALEPALWTFLFIEDVEPTNNAAERALRPAVLWRKGCFGSQSASGLRFAERILTVNATCKQQHRPLLPFLTDSLAAYWAGHPAPALLSTP
jgi:transposase